MRWLKYIGAAVLADRLLALVVAQRPAARLAAAARRRRTPQRRARRRYTSRAMRAACRPSTPPRALDLAYATGFVHAQDRFFQMDLSRRLAAGELSELFGPVALEQDRKARLFRFRRIAREVLAAGHARTARAARGLRPRRQRRAGAALARARGNTGCWRSSPRRGVPRTPCWSSYAMWWDLQVNGLRREILRRELNARLGGPECAGGWKCALQLPLSGAAPSGTPPDVRRVAPRPPRRAAAAGCERRSTSARHRSERGPARQRCVARAEPPAATAGRWPGA